MIYLLRFFLACAGAYGTAMFCAIAVAIFDIYITGHGKPSLRSIRLDYPQLGISLDLMDVAVLVASVAGGIAIWIASGQIWRR